MPVGGYFEKTFGFVTSSGLVVPSRPGLVLYCPNEFWLYFHEIANMLYIGFL